MKIRIIFSLVCMAISLKFVVGQETIRQLNLINEKLVSNQTTITNALTDTASMSLHSLTIFRDIIKQNAKAEKIRITADNEPGRKITVKGIITNIFDKPLENKLVYVYQTSSEGWYADSSPHILTSEGDRRHARLFGYFKTRTDGSFEFETIQPKGYPDSNLPAHIHLEIVIQNKPFTTELLFDDDPRLVGEVRATSARQNYLIAKNEGTADKPVYSYKIVAK